MEFFLMFTLSETSDFLQSKVNCEKKEYWQIDGDEQKSTFGKRTTGKVSDCYQVHLWQRIGNVEVWLIER